MNKLIIRWTIGPVKPRGFDSLIMSVKSLHNLYPEADYYLCYNNLNNNQFNRIKELKINLIDQTGYKEPIGVAWKLYPHRIDINKHEIFIDNDLIIEERIREIDEFISSDTTLMVEDAFRNYGRFNKHIPKKYLINSGLFGVPPQFDIKKYIDFFCKGYWEENTPEVDKESRTFDEQGLVALALLDYKSFKIISKNTISICIDRFIKSKGMHFIALNRRNYHKPFNDYLMSKIKHL